MAYTRKEVSALRDAKVHHSLSEWAPLWLTEETFVPREESLLFTLSYFHPRDGWIAARYKYDAFADVLYQMGSHKLSEAESLQVQDQSPYIDGEVVNQARISPHPRG